MSHLLHIAFGLVASTWMAACVLDWPEPLPSASGGAGGEGAVGGSGGSPNGGGGAGGVGGDPLRCDGCGHFDGHVDFPTLDGGKAIVVATAAEFSAALVAAQYGDEIVVSSSLVLPEPIVLPAKQEDTVLPHRYITIRSADWPGDFPSRCDRVTVAHRAHMPRVEVSASDSAFRAVDGAHHYRLIGFELTRSEVDEPRGAPLVEIGRATVADESLVPHHIELIHVDAHGPSVDGPRVGLSVFAGETKVIGSRFVDIRTTTLGGEVVSLRGGDGPVYLLNSEFQGGGTALVIGREAPVLPKPPNDITVAYSIFTRDPGWVQGAPDMTSFDLRYSELVEIGSGTNIVLEGNIVERALEAYLLQLTAEVGPVRDVMLRNNLLRRGAGGLVLRSDRGSLTERVSLENNIVSELQFWFSQNERFFLTYGDVADLRMTHNTLVNDVDSFGLIDTVLSSWVFENNVAGHGLFGVVCDPCGDVFPGTANGNVVVASDSATFPGDNCFPAEDNFFVNKAAGDFRLQGGPPCGMTTDGEDPGVRFAELEAVSQCRDARTTP